MKLYSVILILVLMIPSVLAYSLSEVSIIPSGSLMPGTSVTVAFQIELTPTGLTTFPEGNTLQLVTDLNNANWTWWIILNGIGNPQPKVTGRLLQITSWELTYRENIGRESVKILLEGIAPQVTTTQNKYIFDILELDKKFNIVPFSETKRTALVLNPADIENGVASLMNDLGKLKTEIDNKKLIGADTSKAEEKYYKAQQETKAAQIFPPSGYINAMKYLTNANETIFLGLKDLDEAWALKSVSDATIPLKATDEIIEYFQGNESTRNNPGLATLITERDTTRNILAVAKGEISNGNYEQARLIATKAQERGNQTYTDAYNLKESVDEYSFIFRVLVVVAATGACISSIILIIITRKKQKKSGVPK